MALLPIKDAYDRLLSEAHALPAETVSIAHAYDRVLAADLSARRTQPPFDASAMDGYAVRSIDTTTSDPISLIGTSAAGRGFDGEVCAGQAVRIFTGAPVPTGADAVLIQENTELRSDGMIVATEPVAHGRNIRRAGIDFQNGAPLLKSGRVLDAAALSLTAASNHAQVEVVRKPRVCLIATGDELVLPGAPLGRDQIIASNSYGVGAIAQKAGAELTDLGIVPDDRDAIASLVRQARETADLIVTLGGASVGDHDLVRPVLEAEGMQLDFWKIAMRPGKPLMYGRFGNIHVLGLPGNPVSSLICAHLFLAPLVARLGGRKLQFDIRKARLTERLKANDQRQDYIRATSRLLSGKLSTTPLPVQDSSMLSSLASANCLIIRPPNAPAAEPGDFVDIQML